MGKIHAISLKNVKATRCGIKTNVRIGMDEHVNCKRCLLRIDYDKVKSYGK